jgi:tripartite-type tricarboxylate transporter receptor subunit TctC
MTFCTLQDCPRSTPVLPRIQRYALHAIGAALLCVLSSAAVAQNFPSRPIKLVVAFLPGGADDFHARLMASKMTELGGQQMIVENRAGAGGLVGWEYVARAPADGYTVLLASAGLAVARVLRPSITLEAFREFAYVALVAQYSQLLVVHPSVPVKTVKDLIALAKARPVALSYASSGIGATPHLAAEYFKSTAKVDIVHIPYKGSPPAYIDIMAGQVDMYFAVPASGLPYVRSVKLRALATTGAKRATLLPDVPTVRESGLDYDISSYWCLLVPAATPRDIIAKLSDMTNRTLSSPDVRDKMVYAGSEISIKTPEQTLAFVKETATKYERIIRAANIKAE